jgi:hypothetical protein
LRDPRLRPARDEVRLPEGVRHLGRGVSRCAVCSSSPNPDDDEKALVDGRRGPSLARARGRGARSRSLARARVRPTRAVRPRVRPGCSRREEKDSFVSNEAFSRPPLGLARPVHNSLWIHRDVHVGLVRTSRARGRKNGKAYDSYNAGRRRSLCSLLLHPV